MCRNEIYKLRINRSLLVDIGYRTVLLNYSVVPNFVILPKTLLECLVKYMLISLKASKIFLRVVGII